MPMIVITKTVGDLVKRPLEHVTSHPDYPLECVEFQTTDDALNAYPGKIPMTVDEYLGYKRAMNLTHGMIQAKKPWWKFWGKA